MRDAVALPAALEQAPAGETIVMTNWVSAPDIDYDTPAILLGARGAACAACQESVEGRRLVGRVFCAEACRTRGA